MSGVGLRENLGAALLFSHKALSTGRLSRLWYYPLFSRVGTGVTKPFQRADCLDHEERKRGRIDRFVTKPFQRADCLDHH